jgi:hypothetical protein
MGEIEGRKESCLTTTVADVVTNELFYKIGTGSRGINEVVSELLTGRASFLMSKRGRKKRD